MCAYLGEVVFHPLPMSLYGIECWSGYRKYCPGRTARRGDVMGRWTKADVTRLREAMLAQGRGIDEIADEVRALCGCSHLAAYRLAHGMSQPEVVDKFLAATDGAFLDQPTLSRLEQFPSRSSRAPLAAHLVPLAAIYGTAPLRLLSSAALDGLDPRERELLLRWGSTLGMARNGGGRGAPAPAPDTGVDRYAADRS